MCEKNTYLLNLEKNVFFYFKIELKEGSSYGFHKGDRKFKKLMQYWGSQNIRIITRVNENVKQKIFIMIY